jgi:hypothetical protein
MNQDSKSFNRANLLDKVKIHLRLAYMNDPSLTTPSLMLKASMRFCESIETCIENQSHQLGLSNHFYYLTAKGSFLHP